MFTGSVQYMYDNLEHLGAKKWLGFRLHLIADATYELMVAFAMTKAGTA